jgi:hypothetical protein
MPRALGVADVGRAVGECGIAALTPADIPAALGRHIDVSALSYFKGGNFPKK